MKKAFTVLLVAALSGCATSNAVLPSLEGKPRVKINATAPTDAQAAAKPAAGAFNFSFKGDILDAVKALNATHPMTLLPPLGKPFPFSVDVNLQGTTLEGVLRAMGEQGGDKVDVILQRSKPQGENQVLIRFNNPKE